MYIFGVVLAVLTFFQEDVLCSTECTFFASYTCGVQHQESVFFEGEEEYKKELSSFIEKIPQEGLYHLAYAMHSPPPFVERVWGEFIGSFQTEVEEDDIYFPVAIAALSSAKSAGGWGSVAGEEKPKTSEAVPFFELSLTTKDKENIKTLITDLADKTYLQLLVEGTSMNRLGARIRSNVHPMRFIGYIFSNPHLYQCLKKIKRDSIKYGEFIKGFEEHMLEKESAEKFYLYAPGFAQVVQTDSGVIEKIIDSKKYVDLIEKFL